MLQRLTANHTIMSVRESEEGFRQMWEDAKARFEKITDQNLTSTRPRSLESALAELDEHFNPYESSKNIKVQKSMQVVANVLKLINLLGGVVASGASVVFGPASNCFNAVQFLIQIPVKISTFYEDLGRLFSEIITFLQKFKIYQRIEEFATIDTQLKEITHKLLITFVDTCALSIDILSGSKWRKLKLTAGIALFDANSGIQLKLEEFRTLIQHQSQISDAVTLEAVLRSEHDTTNSLKNMANMLNKASEESLETLDVVKATRDDVLSMKKLVVEADRSSNEKKKEEQFEECCKMLSISSGYLRDMETDYYNDYQAKVMNETGSWLAEVDIYQRWTGAGVGDHLQLLLSGPRGSGKSFLASSILNTMQTRRAVDAKEQDPLSVAFHDFAKVRKTKEAAKEAAKDPVKDSFKFLAAQLFKSNVVYSRNLLQYLKGKSASFLNEMSIGEVWNNIILEPLTGDESTLASVVLFDEVDQLSDADAILLLDTVFVTKSSRIRIILTGTHRKYQACLKLAAVDPEHVDILEVEEHNEPDIRRFINSKLQSNYNKVLQGDSPGLSKILDRIRQNLPGVAKGNFLHAEQNIRSVCRGVEDDMEEDEIIQRIDDGVLEDSGTAIRKVIDGLNSVLSDREIEQLNEMLIWSIYPYDDMTVDTMHAALYLRFQKVPLQKLEDKIAQKYPDLLRIDKSNEKIYILPRTEDVVWYLRGLARSKGDDRVGVADSLISMSIGIKNAKRSQVRKFFWDLSKKVVLEDFEFTDSTVDPSRAATIGGDPVEGHLSIKRSCFDLCLTRRKRRLELSLRMPFSGSHRTFNSSVTSQILAFSKILKKSISLRTL